MRGFYKAAYDAGINPDQAAEMHAMAIIDEARYRSPDFARGFDKIAGAVPPPKSLPSDNPALKSLLKSATTTPPNYSPEELKMRQQERIRKVYEREATIAAEYPNDDISWRNEMTEYDEEGLPMRRPRPSRDPREDQYGFLPSTDAYSKLPRSPSGRLLNGSERAKPGDADLLPAVPSSRAVQEKQMAVQEKQMASPQASPEATQKPTPAKPQKPTPTTPQKPSILRMPPVPA